MKLSEAILEGAKLRPQAFDTRIDQQGNSCVLGAALEGIGTAPEKIINEFCLEELQQLGLYDGVSYTDLCNTILHQNDVLRLTREQIAKQLQQQGL